MSKLQYYGTLLAICTIMFFIAGGLTLVFKSYTAAMGMDIFGMFAAFTSIKFFRALK